MQVGDQLGFQNETTTQTSTSQSFQSIPVGTILSLRPFISSDGMIRMDVSPQRATGQIVAGIPQTNTTQVSTNVMIPDGQTIVIGGLIDSEVNNGWEGLPFLSRIPLLGYLFRHTDDSVIKKELVVLLTARIVRSDVPDATNYVGGPKTLGLKDRLSQRPAAEAQDGPSLFELARPDFCPASATGEPLPPTARRVVERR